MHLLPRELDKLHMENVTLIARRRLSEGLELNYPLAMGLLASQLMYLAHTSNRYTLADIMTMGKRILGTEHLLPGVPQMIKEVQVESTFADGGKLICVTDPVCQSGVGLELAFGGSGMAVPTPSLFLRSTSKSSKSSPSSEEEEEDGEEDEENEEGLIPGEIVPPPTAEAGGILINPQKEPIWILITNTGSRAIQIGSHYPLIESNKSLLMDRRLAYGRRVNVSSGSAIRFEPGDAKVVSAVEIGGRRVIMGGNGLASGPVSPGRLEEIMVKLKERGFLHRPQTDEDVQGAGPPVPFRMGRRAYIQAYGPTTGDTVRLGDTEIWLEVEHDHTVYGDECVFGGGKNIRDGMAQSSTASELDLVITNALIVDYTGIYKADIGIRQHRIVGIGKAGNPDTMDSVTPGMTIGAWTEVLSAEGKIITAGGVDSHVHFICPQLCTEALAAGITTLIGGGTGPNTGTCATTCTPGRTGIEFMLTAVDDIPLNFGFTGKGNCSNPSFLREQVYAGAVGLKLHEDYGTAPAAIDACLGVCDELDVQATIHTDTLNESGFVEDSVAAFKGRTIHAYHTEGAGGGHAPDIIKVCSLPNVIPSSTNPTRPYTVNTIDEHLDMLMVCHHLDKSIPEDIAFAESRIRGETIGAEDVLHDIGAISIISSDSQAMGRIGETITRTWQTADCMKKSRGRLQGPGHDKQDNFRIKRYISKYTINPAIAHGISKDVGSVEVGKLADLVLWDPAMFGAKPSLVLKGGNVVWAQMGDPNASIPTPQPVIGRFMYGAQAGALKETRFGSGSCLTFVSKASMEHTFSGDHALKLNKKLAIVENCRNIGKRDMKFNDATPQIEVDPETYEVTVDGQVIESKPASRVSLSSRYFLF